MLNITQRFYRVAGVTLALLWLFQVPAVADIYKWRDDNGKLHFTDDRSKIPLKYQQKIQKFKGAPPPATAKKKTSEEPPGTEMSSGQETQAAAEPPGEQSTPQPENKYTADEKIVMTMVYKSLLKLWGVHIRLVRESVVNQKNLKRYAQTSENSATDKKTMYKNIGKWQTPLLLKVRSYLKKTIRHDRKLKKDSEKMMEKVKRYHKRLMRDIPKERELLEVFNVELALGAKPLPTLEAELADGEARRQAKQKHKQKKKSGNNDSSNEPSPTL